MATNVCKLNKYGHCKFAQFCFFKHVDEKCELETCNQQFCDQRHPRDCRYFKKYGVCRFGDFCAFQHKKGTGDHQEATRKHQNVEKVMLENIELKSIITKLDFQIRQLEAEIDEMAKKENGREVEEKDSKEETDESDSEDTEIEESDSKEETDESVIEDAELGENVPLSDSEIEVPDTQSETRYKCDICEYESLTKNGLKIHGGKVHKKTDLKNPAYDNYEVIKAGKCFNLFKTNKASEVTLIGVIHCNDCWKKNLFCTGKRNPSEPHDKTPYKDTDEILNILDTLVIQNMEIEWSEMYSLIVGFELEDWN